MASFDAVFQKKTESIADFRQGKLFRVHYSKLVQSDFQYREITDAAVEKLADLLEADGEVLQPLLVRKKGADSYEILAGHKRFLACRMLVEERGEEKFAMIPCCIRAMNDVKAEFSVYSTNGYESKTPYEIMKEIEGMARLMKEHPEAFPEGKGRLVERLAKQMQMSRSVVSDYQNISHNLGDAGKEAFRAGTLDKSAAVTLASLPEEEQEEILDQGITTRQKIREYIKPKAVIKVIKDEAPLLPEAESSGTDDDSDSTNHAGGMTFRNAEAGSREEKKFPGRTIQPAPVPEPPKWEVPKLDYTVQEKKKILPEETPLQECMGKCPYCGMDVYYPANLHYCGTCGRELHWNL